MIRIKGLLKELAKTILRRLAQLTHFLGFDSRHFGPPRGQVEPQILANIKNSHVAVYPLLPSIKISRTLPYSIDDKIHRNFYLELERTISECYAIELKNGRSIGTQGVVLTSDDYILDKVSPLIPASSKYQHKELFYLKYPKLTKLTGTVGVLTGSGGNGYFHWLYDVFPKLALFSQLPHSPEKYIVAHHDVSFVAQSLNAYGLKSDQLIMAEENSHFEVEKLLTMSPICLSGNPPEWVIKFLQQVFLKPELNRLNASTRIYISRCDARYRKVINEDQLEKMLKNYGFKTITLSSMSMFDQATLFNQAEIIVSPHGGSLSNLAFCKPGTTVVELFSPGYVNVCYWSIANLLQLKYWYLIGDNPEIRGTSSSADFESSMTIDSQKLSRLVKTIISR